MTLIKRFSRFSFVVNPGKLRIYLQLLFYSSALAFALSGCIATGIRVNVYGPVGANRPATVYLQVRNAQNDTVSSFAGQAVVTADGTTGCTAVIAEDGSGSCQIVFPKTGQYSVQATYTPGKDSVFQSSSGSTPLPVKVENARPTSLKVLIYDETPGDYAIYPGQTFKVEVTLYGHEYQNNQSSVSPDTGISVNIDGVGSCNVDGFSTRVLSGSCLLKAPMKSGSFTAKAKFAGDDLYLTSSATAPLTIKAFSTSPSIQYETTVYKHFDTAQGIFNLNQNYALIPLVSSANGPNPVAGTFRISVSGGEGCTAGTGFPVCFVKFTSPGSHDVWVFFTPDDPMYDRSSAKAIFNTPLLATNTTIYSDPSYLLTSESTRVSVTVANTDGSSAFPPTGTVKVEAGVANCSIPLVNGTGSCVMTLNVQGNVNVQMKANYPGDTTHSASQGNFSVRVEQPITLPVPPQPVPPQPAPPSESPP